ncbi:hypothetical protein [Aeromonas hydrophila]|uniref:hypothetical protein n=2 Tax=Aeromonas TaxID=642 RepID=UPI0004935505|nr:hypothetical protein [Aeromonas hydrophila]HAT1545885.1 hypothetical protein [Aeromonas hydrophila]HAT1556622.1 hypothetical protein [Aeromonas hydrophila]
MKKTLIALAVAGLSFNAAAVDLKDGSSVATYASEITLPAVLLDDAGTTLDVDFPLGFSATAGVKRYVRFDLTNAVFQTAVAKTDLTAVTTPASLVPANNSVSVGGAAGDKFVVIEITPAAAIANTETMKLALADIKVLGGDATVQYRLYETGVDAAAGSANTLASKSGTLVALKSGLTAKVTVKGAADKIDVTQESKFFNAGVADVNTAVGTVSIAATPGVLAKDGTAVTLAKLVNTAKLEVAGDFSAGLKDVDGKLLPGAAAFSGVVGAATVTATKAEFPFTAADTGGVLTFTVDGKTAIEAHDMTVKFVPVAQADYTLSALDMGVIGSLTKNGSSATANLVLAPDTSYTNLVRISNTSGIAGKFFITAIADDGKSVTFALSDVAGQPASLAAGASTQQMKVADIYAAAQAKGLALTGDKKLRLKVEGEVGTLSLQNYTVSKDGNALNTMNAFN